MFTIRDTDGKPLDTRDNARSAYIRAIYLAQNHGHVEVLDKDGTMIYTLTFEQ